MRGGAFFLSEPPCGSQAPGVDCINPSRITKILLVFFRASDRQGVWLCTVCRSKAGICLREQYCVLVAGKARALSAHDLPYPWTACVAVSLSQPMRKPCANLLCSHIQCRKGVWNVFLRNRKWNTQLERLNLVLSLCL